MSVEECLYHLKVLSNQNDAERYRSIGQKLGFMPSWVYVCQEAIQHNIPMEYSLIVSSKTAVLLKVSRYDMLNTFHLDVKKELCNQQKVTIDWMQQRGKEAIKGGFQSYDENKVELKLSTHTKTIYPAANRAAQKSIYAQELTGPNENNKAKYQGFKRMRLDP